MDSLKKLYDRFGGIKVAISFLSVLIFRLIPFRIPNVEPIMAFMGPTSKKYGWLSSVLFGSFSILVFDLVTLTIGYQTLLTVPAYALIGGLSYFLFNKKELKSSVFNYAWTSGVGVIIYDGITMLAGPLFGTQTLMAAAIGQITFTAAHLLGAVVFSAILSPFLYNWFNTEKEINTSYIRSILSIKFI